MTKENIDLEKWIDSKIQKLDARILFLDRTVFKLRGERNSLREIKDSIR